MPKTVLPVLAAGSLHTTTQPQLSGLGLLLRPWVDADSPWVLDAFRDPAIQFWHTRTISTLGEAEGLIDKYSKAWHDERGAHWAVVAPDGEILGRASLGDMDLEAGEAELGYWVRPAARGRGTAVAAVNHVTTWAFSIGFHRLIIHHSTHNVASCAVATKAEFILEGTKRSARLHADGWHDMHLHARISKHHASRHPTGSTP